MVSENLCKVHSSKMKLSTKSLLFPFYVLFILFSLYSCSTFKGTSQESEEHRLHREKLAKDADNQWNQLFISSPKDSLDSFKALSEDPFYDKSAWRGQILIEMALKNDPRLWYHIEELINQDVSDPENLALLNFALTHAPYEFQKISNIMNFLHESVQKDLLPDWLKREYSYLLFDHFYFRTGEFEKARGIKDDLHILEGWEFLGPFSNISGSGVNQDFVSVDSDTGNQWEQYSRGINNWELEPFVPELNNPGMVVPVSNYFGKESYHSVYARQIIILENPGDYEWVFSRKGAFEVWLDGEKIIHNNNYYQGMNSFYYNSEMDAGRHEILIKCSNREENSFFNAAYYPLKPGASEPTASDLYESLFSSENCFDPYLMELAQQVEKSPDNLENSFWLFNALLEKGWIEQARLILDNLGDQESENSLYRWMLALFYQKMNEFALYDREMMQLAETGEISAALLYQLQDYLLDDRYAKCRQLLKKLKEDSGLFSVYIDEAEFMLEIEQGEREDLFQEYRDLIDKYPDSAMPQLTLLNYNVSLSWELQNEITEYLISHGYYRKGTLYEILFKQQDRGASAMKHLEKFLQYYPIDEDLWLSYIQLLYDYSIDGVNDIREKTSSTLASFPYSKALLEEELMQSSIRYYDMKAFYDENRSLFTTGGASVSNFLKSMDDEERNYRKSLQALVQYYPYDLETRDLLRELDNKEPFIEKFQYLDSYSVVEDFEKENWQFEECDALIVLDERQEIFFGDGASSVFQHLIIKVNTQQGVEDNRYQYLEFHPSFGDGQVEEAFLIKQDGTRSYAERSGRTLAFPGLSTGDYLILRYYVNSYLPGELNQHFWGNLTLASYYPIYEKSFLLAFPEEMDVNLSYHQIEEDQVDFSRKDFLEGYKSLQFHVSKKEASTVKVFSPDWKDVQPWVDFSTLKSWTPVVQWYQHLYLGQTESSITLKNKVEELCTNAESPEDKIRSIFNFVSAQIEYEDLSFLYSNYVPQTADSVLKEGYGDCKDQSALLIAMLKIAGIDSYMVLNSPDYRGSNPYLPSTRFSHVIVGIDLEEETLYLDPTTSYYTFRETPSQSIGSYILPVKKEMNNLMILEDELELQKSYYLTELSNLNSSTQIVGHQNLQGIQAGIFRSMYKGLTEQSRKDIFNLEIGQWIPGFKMDTLEFENLNDLDYDPLVSFSGTISSPVQAIESNLKQLVMPWKNFLNMDSRGWIGAPESEQNMRVESTYLSTPITETIIFYTPQSFQLFNLPDDLELNFKDSYIRYNYERINDRLLCTREIWIKDQIIQPEDQEAFKEFLLQGVLKERDSFFVRM